MPGGLSSFTSGNAGFPNLERTTPVAHILKWSHRGCSPSRACTPALSALLYQAIRSE